MAEYIEREALIKAIDNNFAKLDIDKCNPPYYHGANDEYADVRLIVHKQPAADVQPVNQWISVEDRQPKPDTMVIVACYGSDIVYPDYENGETIEQCWKRLQKECVRVTIGFIGSDGWYGSEYAPMIIKPTYWQPLPEPPKQ